MSVIFIHVVKILLFWDKFFPMISDSDRLQSILFDRIKDILPDKKGLPAEIADLLDIGINAAYGRINGKTPLKFSEVVTIATHFQQSLDELVGDINPGIVPFFPSSLQQKAPGMASYLKGLKEIMKELLEDQATGIIIASKDLPTFQLFQFPELLQFKMFFWRKTMFDDPSLRSEKFSLGFNSHERETTNGLCLDIARMYAQLDSTEVWTAELVYGLVKQIRYYHELGQFETSDDSLKLLVQAEDMVNFLQKMAEEGKKLLVDNPNYKGGAYDLYRQDLIVNDNVISLILNNQVRTFHVYNSIEYLHTGHQIYGNQVRAWLENLPKRSVAISTFNEKSRVMYFNELRSQLKKLRIELEMQVEQENQE